MPTAWTTFVKECASKKGITYANAMKDPECKKKYHEQKKEKEAETEKKLFEIIASKKKPVEPVKAEQVKDKIREDKRQRAKLYKEYVEAIKEGNDQSKKLKDREKIWDKEYKLKNEILRLNKPLLEYELTRMSFNNDKGKVRFEIKKYRRYTDVSYEVVYYDENGKKLYDKEKIEGRDAYQQLYEVLKFNYRYRTFDGIGITIDELREILPDLED